MSCKNGKAWPGINGVSVNVTVAKIATPMQNANLSWSPGPFLNVIIYISVYWFHSVRPSCCPSIRPASRVRSEAPTFLIGSILYLYILLSNFRRCVACKVSCKILKFEFCSIFKICNFDFVLFLLGIWCDSLVWVIMGRRGYLKTQAF